MQYSSRSLEQENHQKMRYLNVTDERTDTFTVATIRRFRYQSKAHATSY